MRLRRDAGADLGEVQAHHVGVGGRQHQRRARAARRADRAEEVGPGIALVAGRDGTRTAFGPDAGERALLANAGLVLPPELQRPSAGVLWQPFVYEGGKA
jgi:hypothetical protein